MTCMPLWICVSSHWISVLLQWFSEPWLCIPSLWLYVPLPCLCDLHNNLYNLTIKLYLYIDSDGDFAFTMTQRVLEVTLCALTISLYALTMILSSQWFCMTSTTLYDPKNDFVRPQNVSIHFQWLCDFLYYFLVHLCCDFKCPHNDFCVLIIILCAFTMTLVWLS